MATGLSWLDAVWRGFISREGPDIKPILDEWQQWGLCSQPPSSHSLLPLTGGLTNRCWLLHLDNGEFVVRVAAANTRELDIDREHEYRIQQRAAWHGLAPEIRYRSASDHYWLMEHIRGRQLAGPPPADDLPELASCLQQLHQLPFSPDLPEIAIAAKGAHYWQGIQQRWPQDWSELLVPLQILLADNPGPERCICHMDPNPNNWRKDRSGWKLLDWEYAGIGHPLWDMVSFVLMGELNEAEQRYWCQLIQVDAGSHAWQRALLQMRYLNELWFAMQGLRTRPALESNLQCLLANALDLVRREQIRSQPRTVV